ncbi:VOC family protein [Celeribacter sp. SCSIO 80788]|uniref:VOC family protein n=1 Tax=Celeribacter sp. SCSIO 80788 TaxID=3117013 RepID=UPI003DA2A1DC
MTPQRVTLITLGVDDMTRARAFYEALGWQRHPSSQDAVTFYQANGLVLGLFGRADLAADQARPDVPLGTGAMTLAQNFPSEAEVDAAFTLAEAAGATVLKRPEKVFWGGYSGYYADPDGHVWELAYNPFWPLNEDGSLILPDIEKDPE